MILVVLIWILIFLEFFVLGFSVVKLITRITGQEEKRKTVNIDEYFFIGFLTLSTITGFLSICIPIGYVLFSFVSLLSFVLLLVYFREIYIKITEVIKGAFLLKKTETVFLTLLILFVLTAVAQKITFYDTGLYHAQSIQWIQKYSVVPGLGNIHGRLALNSMFFVISALFTFQLKDILIFPLNGLCYIVVIIKLFTLFNSEFKPGTKWKSVFYFLSIMISLVIMIPFLNSASPDIICGILIMYIFIMLIDRMDEISQFDYIKVFLFCMVIFNCITFKISSLFLILALLLKMKNGLIKNLGYIFVVGILVMAPYLIRNYFLSGYLFYPLPSIDIFNVDWKIPYEQALSEKMWISSWARMPGVPYQEVVNMKMSEWILPWFKSIGFWDKFILIPNLFSLITIIIMILKKDFFLAKIQLIIFLNLIFWFLMAPDPRFAYGFLFIGSALTIAYLFKFIEYSSYSRVLLFTKVAMIFFFIIILGRRISIPLEIIKEPSLFLISAPFETAETKEYYSDFKYQVPVIADRCFYCDIPCVPFPLADVILRGDDLQDGFKTIKENH